MGYACCVPSCGKRYNKNGVRNFHTIPKNEARRQKWLKALAFITHEDDEFAGDITKMRVCSNHFEESDFYMAGMVKKVRKDRIPSLCKQKILETDNIKKEVCTEQGVKNIGTTFSTGSDHTTCSDSENKPIITKIKTEMSPEDIPAEYCNFSMNDSSDFPQHESIYINTEDKDLRIHELENEVADLKQKLSNCICHKLPQKPNAGFKAGLEGHQQNMCLFIISSTPTAPTSYFVPSV